MYVECTVVYPDEPGTRNRKVGDEGQEPRTRNPEPGVQEWIYDCINEVHNEDFLVGLRYEVQGTQKPGKREIIHPFESWLGGLDPEAVRLESETTGQLPRRTVRIRDWIFACSAHPKPPYPMYEGRVLLGFLPRSTENVIDDFGRIRDALSQKGRRYGRLDRPYVVAILGTGFTDEAYMTDVVFGAQTPVRDALGNLQSVLEDRLLNGYWRQDPAGSDSERGGARVSAVLFGQSVLPWWISKAFPKLWVNPWAYELIAEHDQLTTFTATNQGKILREAGSLTAQNVFGLPIDWPQTDASGS